MGEIFSKFTKRDPKLNPVILIHGSLQNHSSLDKIAEFFQSKNHSTLIFDLPGHGKSEHSEKCYLEILDKLIKENNIQNPIILGHSFGGSLATKYSIQKQNPKALITINAPITSPEEMGFPLEETHKACMQESISKFIEKKEINYQELQDYTNEEIRNKGLQTTPSNSYEKNLKFFKELPTLKELSKIKSPTLLITSTTEPIAPPEYVKLCAFNMPNPKVEITKEGHNAIIKNPQAINNIINKYYDFLFGQ